MLFLTDLAKLFPWAIAMSEKSLLSDRVWKSSFVSDLISSCSNWPLLFSSKFADSHSLRFCFLIIR